MPRVLVMDDEPNIAMVLDIFLTGEGYQVTTAPNGLAGLKQLEQNPLPDIVLVDLVMPQVNGRTVVETMRSNPEYRDIPIVLLTGSMPNPEQFPPAGSYQTLINKPFNLEDISHAVDRLTRYKSNDQQAC